MNCPVCDDVKLREVLKEYVLIDVCPNCKGVWLDRGELDKLMSGVHEIRQEFDDYQQARYNQPQNTQQQYTQQQYTQPQYTQQPYQQQPNYPQAPYGKHKYKKKKTVLDIFEDLFD
jgi:Zn-finger nucleic acid-binding protein